MIRLEIKTDSHIARIATVKWFVCGSGSERYCQTLLSLAQWRQVAPGVWLQQKHDDCARQQNKQTVVDTVDIIIIIITT